MLVTLSGIDIILNLAQFLNAESATAVVPGRISSDTDELSYPTTTVLTYETPFSTSIRFGQFVNAFAAILVTLSGIVMPVNPVQPENALSPMLVTPSGIVMLVNPVQPENAELLMLVTLSPIVMLVKLLQL